MIKSMHDLDNKNPTMSQKLDILEKWFVSSTGNKLKTMTIREVGELIVSKALANDIDSAMKIVFAQLELN